MSRSLKFTEPLIPFSFETKQKLEARISESTFILFDLETTGGNPENNCITEVAALKVNRGLIIDRFTTLVNPLMPIPPIVRRITGITNNMVRKAPRIHEVMPDFLRFIGKDILVSHNTIGDLKFLRYFAKDVCGVDLESFFLCTHLLVEKLIPEAKDKSLGGLGTFLDIPSDELHRAEEDALLTHKLFEHLKGLLQQRQIETPIDAIRFQGDVESNLRLGSPIVCENVPAGPGIYSFYDRGDALLYYSSSMNLARDLGAYAHLKQLEKAFFKLAIGVKKVAWEEHPSVFEAMRAEANFPRKPDLSSNLTHKQAVKVLGFQKSEGPFYKIFAGPLQSSTLSPHIFKGDPHQFIIDLGKVLGLEINRKGSIQIPEELLPIVKAFLRKTLVLEHKKNTSFFVQFLSLLRGRDLDRILRQIAEWIPYESDLPSVSSLVDMNGLLCAPPVKGRNTWVYQRIVHGLFFGKGKESLLEPKSFLSTFLGKRFAKSIFSRASDSKELIEQEIGEDYVEVNACLWLIQHATSLAKVLEISRHPDNHPKKKANFQAHTFLDTKELGGMI